MTSKRPVLITTEHRGVFFGYVEDESEAPTKITLTNARIVVFWSQAVRGVLGLAAIGPSQDCRIGLSVPRFTAWKITSITDCTPEATEKFEIAPWK